MNNRLIVLYAVVLLALLFSGVNLAQKSHNSIYAELFGNAGGYSVNYERTVYQNISLRAGFMFVSDASAFPVLVNYRIYSGENYFSVGAGILNWHVYSNYKITNGEQLKGSGLMFTARINYTLVTRNGLFLGISFTPFVYNGKMIPFGGFSFGYEF
ncbi:hypothetical protein ACSSWA_09605 [Melioribacter sp. Ez-97]|uniref:hypothetical protein n=1 Tax=Melioribacter sp. Ez-97 TaxID=3423434 RepID=UPI003ED8926C